MLKSIVFVCPDVGARCGEEGPDSRSLPQPTLPTGELYCRFQAPGSGIGSLSRQTGARSEGRGRGSVPTQPVGRGRTPFSIRLPGRPAPGARTGPAPSAPIPRPGSRRPMPKGREPAPDAQGQRTSARCPRAEEGTERRRRRLTGPAEMARITHGGVLIRGACRPGCQRPLPASTSQFAPPCGFFITYGRQRRLLITTRPPVVDKGRSGHLRPSKRSACGRPPPTCWRKQRYHRIVERTVLTLEHAHVYGTDRTGTPEAPGI